MTCRHAGKEVEYGFECKITNQRCKILNCDEDRCAEQKGGIINYLKAIGTYETRVLTNPAYTQLKELYIDIPTELLSLKSEGINCNLDNIVGMAEKKVRLYLDYETVSNIVKQLFNKKE